MAVIHDRNRLLAFFALLVMAFVPSPALGQKKPGGKGIQKLDKPNALIEKAKALDKKIYPPQYDAALRQSNEDFLALREEVIACGKKHRVRLQPMLDSRSLIFRGEKMLRPYFNRFLRIYDMNCFLTGFEFSHSTFMGYYSCIRSD